MKDILNIKLTIDPVRESWTAGTELQNITITKFTPVSQFAF